ncbi:hypothetical protein RFI_17514 [Reticulomyxa filosa]|uniref:Uncharacterized protein n=1 Tax=Reticulomyxa filosa TaxID=46433 RepID=X6N0B0_RETFI|nr:hypothetical protein RFI_17514 [Reticulomyxa filosa]|eukprot:ETO19715.1 hypothetical protein RFI_17514 [Reticulomyxa filosa]
MSLQEIINDSSLASHIRQKLVLLLPLLLTNNDISTSPPPTLINGGKERLSATEEETPTQAQAQAQAQAQEAQEDRVPPTISKPRVFKGFVSDDRTSPDTIPKSSSTQLLIKQFEQSRLVCVCVFKNSNENTDTKPDTDDSNDSSAEDGLRNERLSPAPQKLFCLFVCSCVRMEIAMAMTIINENKNVRMCVLSNNTKREKASRHRYSNTSHVLEVSSCSSHNSKSHNAHWTNLKHKPQPPPPLSFSSSSSLPANRKPLLPAGRSGHHKTLTCSTATGTTLTHHSSHMTSNSLAITEEAEAEEEEEGPLKITSDPESSPPPPPPSSLSFQPTVHITLEYESGQDQSYHRDSSLSDVISVASSVGAGSSEPPGSEDASSQRPHSSSSHDRELIAAKMPPSKPLPANLTNLRSGTNPKPMAMPITKRSESYTRIKSPNHDVLSTPVTEQIGGNTPVSDDNEVTPQASNSLPGKIKSAKVWTLTDLVLEIASPTRHDMQKTLSALILCHKTFTDSM